MDGPVFVACGSGWWTILDLLASGLTQEQVIEELPDLENPDIEAALKYAGSKLDHPIIAA